jgi:hypothetical protein
MASDIGLHSFTFFACLANRTTFGDQPRDRIAFLRRCRLEQARLENPPEAQSAVPRGMVPSREGGRRASLID